jgi:NADH:ubiquinone oxidoreductase subunit E
VISFTSEVGHIMIKISICVGSACHLSGAHAVLNAFQLLVQKHQVSAKIDIEGNFCQGHCTEGVVIKINDEIIDRKSTRLNSSH